MRASSALWFSLLTAGALPAAALATTENASNTAPAPDTTPSAGSIAELAGLARLPMGATTRVALPVAQGEEILELTRFTNLAPGATVVSVDEQGVEHPIDLSDLVLLRGIVAGEPDSMAFLSISDGQVNGFVQVDGTTRVISSGEAGQGQAIRSALTSELRLGDGNPFCSVDDGNAAFYPRGMMPVRVGDDATDAPAPTRGGAPCRVARIAIDTDYEFTQLFGGNTALSAAYAQTLMAAVSMIYERDVNVRLMVPYIRVWASNNDPYVLSGGTIDFLFEMRDHWNLTKQHVPRETVQGLSGRGLGGGVAYVNALCFSEFAHGASANLNGFFPMPVQDNSHQNWDLMVVAHELGHNFGTGHTHDSGSYNPPIDNCGNGDCSQSLDSTIMSYCHTCPGGLSNMDMRFHPRVQTRILQFLDGAACDLVTGPSVVARDDDFVVLQNTATELDLLSNDAGSVCAPPALAVSNLPATTTAGGTLELITDGNATLGGVRYTPSAGFSGVDSFAYAISSGGSPAGAATVNITVEPVRQPVTGVTTEPGVDVSYYVLNNPAFMPDFDVLTPYATDIVSSINFPSTSGDFATSGRADQVGAVFEGLVEVPQTGWYQLSVESDDGSLLYLGEDLVIDNDGLHGMVDASAFVALGAGKHPVRVEFFENGGGAGLTVRSFGGGQAREPVPASSWSRAVGNVCGPDLAEPFGTLNFFDVAAYLSAFNAGDASADIAAPFGVLNFFDISQYMADFNAGCP